MTNWKQLDTICPQCRKSYFVKDDKCNVCGKDRKGGGRLWSKKLHRYLTEDEVKAGMKGG